METCPVLSLSGASSLQDAARPWGDALGIIVSTSRGRGSGRDWALSLSHPGRWNPGVACPGEGPRVVAVCPCDMGPSQDRTCRSSWGLPPSPVSHTAIPLGSRPGEVSVLRGSGRGWPHARLTARLFVAAELEFAQVVVVVVVVTVMVVVIFCLLNHYRASTRSFIHRPGQGQRQEDRPQLVSVGWEWVSLGLRLGLGARAQDGTGLSSYIHRTEYPVRVRWSAMHPVSPPAP